MSLLVLVALIAGAMLAAQDPIFARSASHAGGSVQTAILAFAVALGALFAIWTCTGNGLPRSGVLRMPIWIWIGGLIGIAVVLLTIHAVPRIGTGTFVSAVVCGQLIAALLYDHIGAFGLETRRIGFSDLAGMTLLLAGTLLIAGQRDG